MEPGQLNQPNLFKCLVMYLHLIHEDCILFTEPVDTHHEFPCHQLNVGIG